jgi:hypothetical protein
MHQLIECLEQSGLTFYGGLRPRPRGAKALRGLDPFADLPLAFDDRVGVTLRNVAPTDK